MTNSLLDAMRGCPGINRIRILGTEDAEHRLDVKGAEGPISRERLRVMANLKNAE